MPSAVLSLVLASLTGAGLACPETLREVARPWLGMREASRHPAPASPGLAAAIAGAEALLPGYRTCWIDLPLPGGKEPTAFNLRPADGRLSGPAVVLT